MSYGGKTVNVRIRGVSPDFGPMRHQYPQPGGRFLDPLDLAQKRRVVFLGDKVARDLFADEDPVGRSVEIEEMPYLVIGVMQKKTIMGMYSGPDDNQVTIPATTYKGAFTDATPGNFVYKPLRPELADRAKAEVYRILGGRYRFDPEDERALGVWDTRENQRLTDNIAEADLLEGVEIAGASKVHEPLKAGAASLCF